MGREIHWQIEYFINDKWHHLRPESPYGRYERYIYKWRDMQMFDLLAGAGRGVHKPVYPPRGLPEDMSASLCRRHVAVICDKPVVQRYVLGEHHQSWLTYQELCHIRDCWFQGWSSDLFQTVLPCMDQLLVDMPAEHGQSGALSENHLRAVFGFSD